MARCPKCGKESPDQARFCRSCGGELRFDVEDAVAPDARVTPEQRSQRLLEEAFRLSEQGRILAAVQTCQQALALNPQSTSAHSLLGTLYERQGDREKAIREYEQVLTLSPESTVERRRLNELMGVPAAREAVTVPPRTARLAITGAFVVLVLVVFAAFTLTKPAQPQKEGGTLRTVHRGSGGQPVTFDQGSPMLPSPGRTFVPSARLPLAPPPMRQAASSGAVTPARASGGPTYLGLGAYLYPSVGADRYYAGRRAAAVAPLAGGQPYRGTPIVSGAPWAPVAGGVSQQSARSYYLQGDYRQAAATYQQYIAQHPSAGAAREELAWVYMQMGERTRAEQQYREASDSYQADLERGHNMEAARHGLRTCQSALRALETQ